jgi:hypothetical protein
MCNRPARSRADWRINKTDHGRSSIVLGVLARLRYLSFRLGEPNWNANRTSEPGLGANESVPSGMWRKPTAFRHFCARSSKRTAAL